MPVDPVPFDRATVFAALPDVLVVLDPELLVRDANPAFLAVTGLALEDVVGRHVVTTTEPRADDPGAVDRLLDGYAAVVRTGRGRTLGVARYDFPDPDDPSRLEPRYWSVEVTPLHEGTRLTGVLHRARDVTAVHEQLLRAVEAQRELLGEDRAPALEEVALHSANTARVAAALTTEVEQLREAMASRAGIEQAKGALMGRHGIGPDEAFALLARLSQDTNRKLRDVAAALLESVGASGAGADPGAADAPCA